MTIEKTINYILVFFYNKLKIFMIQINIKFI